MGLEEYRRKRDFGRTAEPSGAVARRRARALSFVIQKHAASHLHYDFRLEMEGVLRSWAVPKGPSLDPGEKRLAVQVEDHPLAYGSFEGTIPAGEYGGGTVLLWDRGTWTPDGDAVAMWRKGHLEFSLDGTKLHGRWTLVRLRSRGDDRRTNWLLIKRTDEAARGDGDILEERPESVSTGRDLDDIAGGRGRRRVWSSTEGELTGARARNAATGPARARGTGRAGSGRGAGGGALSARERIRLAAAEAAAKQPRGRGQVAAAGDRAAQPRAASAARRAVGAGRTSGGATTRGARGRALGAASGNGRAARSAARSSGAGSIVLGVPLSHADRVLWPDRALTKLDLARWWERIADRIMPHLERRPVTLLRCPQGEGHACFVQRHATGEIPQGVAIVPFAVKGGTRQFLVVKSATGLVALAQLGVLEVHAWGSRAPALDKPDRLVFDLDPGEGVRFATVVEAARAVRERLERCDLRSYVKTSGGRGLHVVVPIAPRADWVLAGAFASAIAAALVREAPDRYIDTMSKARRRGRVFIDWLRNAPAASAVAIWSPRARAGAPVSTPVRWEDLDRIDPGDFTIPSLMKALPRGDPWRGFFDVRQSLTEARIRAAAE